MKHLFSSIFAILLASAFIASAQDHSHLYVGAANNEPGAPLVIQNAADFVTTSDYVKTLNFTNGGRYAGYFEGNITFEAKSATDVFGDPDPNSAALGAWIFAEIVAVEGPSGGAFGFWETGAITPTFNILSGSNSTNEWVISQNNGAPGSNPYGHIHGRRFTATRPGIYVVSFRTVDRSTNGAGGGPIHTPSQVLKVAFQAGIAISDISRTTTLTQVRFGTSLGGTFYLESNTNLSSTNWSVVNFVSGDDHFQTLTDFTAAPEVFYRIRVSTP
jgi:hypothetical protein